MSLTELREEVCYVNKMLPAAGLVTMHSGNASGLDRPSGRLVIKPSGVDYDRLRPEDLVEVDLESGEVIGSRLRPSVDLPHHLFLYRHLSDVGAVIHTHSNYATAMAAVGKPIPLCLTAIADEFGAEIPCCPYVDNEGDHIGQAILKHRNRAPGHPAGQPWRICLGGQSAGRVEGRRDDRRRRQDRPACHADRPAAADPARGGRKMV